MNAKQVEIAVANALPYKVQLSIETENIVFDPKAYLEIDLPFIPRINDILYISEEQEEALAKIILATKNYWDYRECFYYKSANAEKLEDFNPEDFNIQDWIYVTGVAIRTRDNSILISLGQSPKQQKSKSL